MARVLKHVARLSAIEQSRRSATQVEKKKSELFAVYIQARPMQSWFVSYPKVTDPRRRGESKAGWCLGVRREIEMREGGFGRISVYLRLKKNRIVTARRVTLLAQEEMLGIGG